MRGAFGRFLCVGLAGLAADAAVFSLLHGAGLTHAMARALSLIVATAVTWGLNRRFTFSPTGRRKRSELGRYILVTLAAQGLSYGLFLTLCRAAPTVTPLIPLFMGAAIATGVSFAGQRLFTFGAATRPVQ